MTKISFDVDFSEDPEKIFKQIQDRAKAEVDKRESKERVSAYLSRLHEKVNDDINTEFKSVTDLIRVLSPFASPALKDKLSATSPSGRRKTISMDKETFDNIKDLLAQPNPNKAAIGRETGVSVVQVRKVASGGYDDKFGPGAPSAPSEESPVKEEADSPAEEAEEKTFVLDLPNSPGDDESEDEPPAPDLPGPPSFGEENDDLPAPPSFGDDELPAPPSFGDSVEPPAPDLPAPPSFGDDELPAPPSFEDSDEPPAPPSFGNDEPPAPPSFEDSDEPPAPDLPEPPSFGDSDEPPAPPSFGDDEPPAPPSFGDVEPPAPPSFGDSDEPPAPPSFGDSDEPPAPEPPAPPSFGDDEPPAPPSFGDSDELPAPPPAPEPPTFDASDEPPVPPSQPGLTRPPTLAGNKLGLRSGKPGKPSLSLKPGKSKIKGLKITRPPNPGTLPPPAS